ncbi:transcriptional regulator [Lentzea guizhouensis]|uniref:Transcriptional regulator n=1 Tax=Lentzea guizhouensis TaxID=1586287 RepID=A0A1B2HAZ8_9PSEU|nr:PadR family transcriptional regulator [Lentzea guizhouensis]ANZ34892.1 transcriptional regulator [Lentzea guizhouensis]
MKNPLGMAVLGLLMESPLHPHAMAATLKERGMDRAFKVTTGSLYDVVRALVRDEWIEARETIRVGARPERTVYGLTALGQQEFTRWVDRFVREPQPEYPKFLSAVSYLGALGKDGAVAALQERAERLRTSLEEMRDGHAKALQQVPRLFVVEVEYAMRMTEAELGWVEEVIGEVEGGGLAWPEG